jgi:long-chain acyl-CoA synthetase
MKPPPVQPDLWSDPVAAVVRAHLDGADLRLRTSGTTEASRRVVQRSTTSWWASFDDYTALTGVERGARVWLPGPLTATMNLFAAVHARAVGATISDVPHTATHACLTPAQLARCAESLSAGTRVLVAGDRLTAAQLRTATARALIVAHYYGAAELSFVAWGESGDDLVPFPGVKVSVRDGVIWANSPYLARSGGSLRTIDDGWSTVGDLGRFTDGRLVVLGRPGVVVSAGATVVLAEVEAELARAARGPFAVLGLPHPGLGSVVCAAVTDPRDRTALQRHARAHLLPGSRPRTWLVVERLPLTALGKVDRECLAALF